MSYKIPLAILGAAGVVSLLESRGGRADKKRGKAQRRYHVRYWNETDKDWLGEGETWTPEVLLRTDKEDAAWAKVNELEEDQMDYEGIQVFDTARQEVIWESPPKGPTIRDPWARLGGFAARGRQDKTNYRRKNKQEYPYSNATRHRIEQDAANTARRREDRKSASEGRRAKTRKPSKRAREEWMSRYDKLMGSPQPPPQGYWDTATYLFNTGISPDEAAGKGQRAAGRAARSLRGYGYYVVDTKTGKVLQGAPRGSAGEEDLWTWIHEVAASPKGLAVWTRKGVLDKFGQIKWASNMDREGQRASSPQVAATIIQQLGGTGRLSAMINAKNFISYPDGVGFKFSNRKGPNHVKIVLNGRDYYDVTFSRIRGYDFKTVAQVDDVPVSNLRSVIEGKTGLYLSL